LAQRAWLKSRFSKVISSERVLPSSSTSGMSRQHAAVVAAGHVDAQALHEQGGECRQQQLCGHARFHNCTPAAADKDGLPKLKDFPAEIGGSGETLPE
jgi:hypothetical protein